MVDWKERGRWQPHDTTTGASDIQGGRARARRGARHRVHPALVHRHPRPAEELRGGQSTSSRARSTDGMGFDGSSITGFNRIEESDMIAMPDPNTFAVLPWRPQEKAVARMFCDVLVPGGEPYEGDPRYVMRRALERAQRDGLRRLLPRARARVLLLPPGRAERRPAGGARQGRLLRPHDARRRIGPAARDRARARGARHRRRVHRTTRSGRRSTRSTCASPTACGWPTTR